MTVGRLHHFYGIVHGFAQWAAAGCVVFGLSGGAEASSGVTAEAPPLSATPGLTSNQLTLVAYFDALCLNGRTMELPRACDALRDPTLSDDQVRAEIGVFDPEPLITAAGTALGIAATQNDNVMHRIAALRSGSRGLDVGGLNLGIGDQRIGGDALNAVSRPTLGGILNGVLSEHSVGDRLGLFANGHVGSGYADPANIAPDRQFNEVTTGIDYRVQERFVLGASFGYSALGNDRAVPSTALDITSWRSAMFGTYYDEHFHIDGLLGYDSTDYASLRHVQLADVNGLTQAYAKGSSDGRQLSAQLMGAFDFRYGAWRFGPRVGASFIDAEVDPLREVATGNYALAVGSQNAQSIRSSAGAEISMPQLTSRWLVVTPRASADFVRDLANHGDVVDVRLVNDLDGSVASMQVDRTGSGYFIWSIGAGAQVMRHLSGFVDYRSSAGEDDAAWTYWSWGLRFEAPL